MKQIQKDFNLAESVFKNGLDNPQCPEHKRYKGKTKPKVPCPGCWEYYIHACYKEANKNGWKYPDDTVSGLVINIPIGGK